MWNCYEIVVIWSFPFKNFHHPSYLRKMFYEYWHFKTSLCKFIHLSIFYICWFSFHESIHFLNLVDFEFKVCVKVTFWVPECDFTHAFCMHLHEHVPLANIPFFSQTFTSTFLHIFCIDSSCSSRTNLLEGRE